MIFRRTAKFEKWKKRILRIVLRTQTQLFMICVAIQDEYSMHKAAVRIHLILVILSLDICSAMHFCQNISKKGT